MADTKNNIPGPGKNPISLGNLKNVFRSDIEKAWLQALKITSIYFLIGSLWIIMSDRIAGLLVTNKDVLVNVNIIKGWFYVLVTSAILFRLISKEIKKLINAKKKTDLINIELENSNTLFSAILESSPEIMVFSIDKNYVYTAFNNRHKYSMLRRWQYDIKIGENMLDVISSPEIKTKSKENFDRALSGEYFTLVEEFGSDKNPHMYWQNYFSPILAKDRSVIGLTCFVLNITALKRAQEKNQYLSYHDTLTGLYNRRYYEEALYRIDKAANLPISIIIGDLNGLKLVNDAFGHQIGDEMLKKAADALQSACRQDDILARWGGDEFIILLPKTDLQHTEEIVKKAKSMSARMNVNSVNVDISFGWATKTEPEVDIQSEIKNAEDFMYKNKLIESKSMRSHTIKTIMNTLHEKNPREEEHSKRVGEICRKIGSAMHLSDIDVSTLNLVGFLHDIGKIAIEEGILNKPGKLSDLEFEAIKQHPEIGCRIIRSSYEISEVAEAILSHHERWDGSGYPKGQIGSEIPRFARIICIADSFDAMTSERTYRDIWSNEKAAEEIKRCAGTQFDPEIARIFVEDVLGIQW
ncbi:MAG: diguanylate cyclase [Eubacteriales bacterium]